MLASCTKEENAPKGSSITSTIDSVNIVVNPWTEVSDTATLGELDSASLMEWLHLIYGDSIPFIY